MVEEIREQLPATVDEEIVEFAEGETFEFEAEGPRAGLLTLLTLAGVGVVIGVTVLLFYYYDWYRGAREQEVVYGPEWIQTIQQREEDNKKLGEYGYANSEKTVVRIPIEQAMKIVVQEAKEGKYRQNIVQKASAAPAAAPAASAASPASPPAPAAPPAKK